MNATGLKFLIRPASPVGEEILLTSGRISVLVDDHCVWPAADAEDVSLDIQIDDLLSHLTEFWKPLMLRQTYPIPVSPYRPMQLRAKAEDRWEKTPPEVAEREDEQLCAFEEAHDLSRCFAGYFGLQPLWLLRAGERMIVDSSAGFRTVPFAQASVELTRVGDEIADRLADSRDRKWTKLIERWRTRDQGDPTTLLAWTTSLDRDTASSLAKDGTLSAPNSVKEAANDNDELRIAARMASALPPAQIREILSVIRTFEKQNAPALYRLSDHVCRHVDDHFAFKRAHEQGEAAARFVREQLNLPTQLPVDIEAIMKSLGIKIVPRKVKPTNLDALAVSGMHFGPAVLLNLESNHGGRRKAARITLAHELCHLLLDHGHALSAIEILNSRMPPDIERRAKSFAGEIMLPSNAAVETWRHEGSPRSLEGLKGVVKTLETDFDVTRSVATWKLEHGLSQQGIDLSVLLDAIAPYR